MIDQPIIIHVSCVPDGTLDVLISAPDHRPIISKGWRTYSACLEYASKECARLKRERQVQA